MYPAQRRADALGWMAWIAGAGDDIAAQAYVMGAEMRENQVRNRERNDVMARGA